MGNLMKTLKVSNVLKKTGFISLRFISEVHEISMLGEGYVIVGNDYECLIGVHKESGYVFSLQVEEKKVVLINSSIALLEEFISLFGGGIDLNEKYSEGKRFAQVKRLRDTFHSLDRNALQEKTWWSLILEQVEDGLL